MLEPGNQTPAADTESAALRDEEGALRPEFVERVHAAVEAGDAATLRALVGELHEADLGDLLEALDPDERPRLIELMGADFDFTALIEVDDAVREEILEELPPEAVAEGVRELDSDDAVYILEDLPKDEQAEILDQLPAARARRAHAQPATIPRIRPAGGCRPSISPCRPRGRVGNAIDYLRETADLPERFYELYVVDPRLPPVRRGWRSTGCCGPGGPRSVSELMDAERRRVRATDDQEEVARLFERYNLIAAPVVDEADRLVGVITVDDVVDVIEEEAEEDIKALGGVTGDEQLSDTVWTIARGRFNWLLVNLATAFLASSVLGLFEGELQKMVALAVLAPIVASQGGNAATQTMTVAVRALATRELRDSQCAAGSFCAS